MPTGPAARLNDTTAHGFPLAPGPPSTNVIIGGQPAWLGVPLAMAGGIMGAGAAAQATVMAASSAATAAMGTPGAPAAIAALAAAGNAQIGAMQGMMSGSGASMMVMCQIPIPPPVAGVFHGPGVVVTGSATVLINGKPACRLGDTVQEAVGGTSSVVTGCTTVIIGG